MDLDALGEGRGGPGVLVAVDLGRELFKLGFVVPLLVALELTAKLVWVVRGALGDGIQDTLECP